ncbi:GFA family protein [Litorilituus sediminis]|uniref:GFA family protein n=1 Tax=Litorilituus sediminis TaxID=718192 RepID=A0A4V0ZGD3_9GAMM|nr:GFA family protein [Litorilituus sediminis]QBG36900.1 GFA family protein [Litorilituus sediminis]
MSVSGSCLCGEVNFEIDGDFESFYLCHCKYCQKDTGSAHASNLFSSVAKLVWQSGQEKIKTYELPSTRHIKSFCSNCGSALPSLQMNDKLLVVPAGSLNQDISIKANAHIFTSSRANWDCGLENIKSYEQLPQ